MAAKRTKEIPLIPRKTLKGNPDKTNPSLSRDGSQLGFLAPVNGVLNVWVGPADDVAAAKPVTKDTGRGIRIFFWAYTNRHIIYLQDKNGDENWRVYSVDLDTGATKDLTPLDKVNADVVEVSYKRPLEILVGLNDRDPKFHDLHCINIITGERTLVQTNPEFAGFCTDDYAVRFAVRMVTDGGTELLRPAAGGWELYLKIPAGDSLTTHVAGFNKWGTHLHLRSSLGRDTAAAVEKDLASGQETVLAEDSSCDVGELVRHPTEKHVQAVSFVYERQRWEILDKTLKGDFKHLRKVESGDFSIVSRTLDDRKWIVVYYSDSGPARYYLFDRATQQARFLFADRPELEGLRLTKMHPQVIASRDGLKLVCFLSLPPKIPTKAPARPASPQPMVLLVHGGPWGRDGWGLNAYHQWLANRGYAVLSVNFRGSTSFGKTFVNAGDREWAGTMHHDLIDAVEWAVKEGIAQRERVAIMGGSYGGYATLVGLTFTPETFCCGVDIVGPSNLVTLLNTIPPYWTPMLNLFKNRVGDPATEEGRAFLNSRSPLTFAGRIKRPLLIGQGANDPRVKQSESDQIVKALQANKIPVTYVVYSDEGHGFARPENRLSFDAITEAFLAEFLGGRCEPIGEDFKGAKVKVPVGAERIRGLTEALAKVAT